MAICKAAFDLIVEQEISDEATYRKKYQHFDWPDGASGPTVGISCVYNGVTQVPGDAYTVSGSQITFTFTPASGDSCALWAVST